MLENLWLVGVVCEYTVSEKTHVTCKSSFQCLSLLVSVGALHCKLYQALRSIPNGLFAK